MNQEMQVAVLHAPGDVRLESRPVPLPGPGQVRLRVRRAGICGSDLHYFTHGQCGAFVPTAPFVLGHEAAGEVDALGGGVDALERGTRVAINPACSCGRCQYCRAGRENLCAKTVMLGSASTQPPTDGVFAEYVCVAAHQCHPLPDNVDDATGGMLEPLAVALQAVHRAGDVSGRPVLVTGAGPIGLLTAMVARAFGAAPVVVSDPVDSRRRAARTLAGADAVIDPTRAGEEEPGSAGPQGEFAIVFEASGRAAALRQAVAALARGGRLVQIGTPPATEIPFPASLVMSRELEIVGSFRYAHQFDRAINLITWRRFDLRPFVTDVLPFAAVGEALGRAATPQSVLKVQLAFP